MGLFNGANAADTTVPAKAPVGCKTVVDPYKNYSCLDAYLGTTFMERFVNYYRLEWGHEVAPADPKAPPSTPRLLADDAAEHAARCRSPNGPMADRPTLA